MIEVTNLTKHYGDHIAVDNLSFTVKDGTVYGFLGPNGAGKSTTMNMLTGYLAPDSGSIIVNGFNLAETPKSAKRTIGYLPEQPPVYPDMTVREYLSFVAELRRIPKKDRRAEVERVIEELELSNESGRLIRNLSKGFRQRVGFAQALIGNPETLILDEPTVGLDPKQIIEIRELIRELGKKHTVILSSHILSEVNEICTEILIMSHGKLVACGTPENLAAMSRKKQELVLTVKGGEDEVRDALLKAVVDLQNGINDVAGNSDAIHSEQAAAAAVDGTSLQIREADGIVTVRLPLEDGEGSGAMRGRILSALVEANLELIEMKNETTSLEDIFLELTADTADNDEEMHAAEDESAAGDRGLNGNRTEKNLEDRSEDNA